MTIGQLEQTAVAETLQDCIDTHEPDYMDAALGVGFYEAFKTGLLEGTPEQRWLDLKLGKLFTSTSGNSCRWVGFAPAVKTNTPPNAAYVYWQYMRETAIQTGGVGSVQGQVENGAVVSPMIKQSQAWNLMLKFTGQLWEYLRANKETYPEYDENAPNEHFFGRYLQNSFGI